nr:LEAF RUST 10 DISEASE-RESISTANCE LOCUS RECEPTOR-LIKE PROTEIN KINASE-like 2.1 [Coffea arabica]
MARVQKHLPIFFTATNASQLRVTCANSIWVSINRTAAQNLVTSVAVTVRAVLTAGFWVQYEANNSICSECNRSGGWCGYNTSSNSFACYCSDRPYDRMCNRTSFRSQKGYFIAIAIGGTVEKLAVCMVYSQKTFILGSRVVSWRSDEENNEQVEAFVKEHGSIAPKLYKYSEVKKMTNSFADILGHGGYGSVYRGKLSDGRLVAVKVLNDDKGSEDEFINEVASICRTSHVNVVTLLGHCYDRKKRALTHEFMPNGSLDRFIHEKESSEDTNTDCQLERRTLYEIAVATARGVEYLHRGWLQHKNCSLRHKASEYSVGQRLLSQDL